MTTKQPIEIEQCFHPGYASWERKHLTLAAKVQEAKQWLIDNPQDTSKCIDNLPDVSKYRAYLIRIFLPFSSFIDVITFTTKGETVKRVHLGKRGLERLRYLYKMGGLHGWRIRHEKSCIYMMHEFIPGKAR